MENIKNLEKWKEVTKGLFRYVVAANACYEIHLLYHALDTDIMTAKASLFIVGDWNGGNGSFFERECLMKEQPLFECLNCAYEDERKANGGT